MSGYPFGSPTRTAADIRHREAQHGQTCLRQQIHPLEIAFPSAMPGPMPFEALALDDDAGLGIAQIRMENHATPTGVGMLASRVR